MDSVSVRSYRTLRPLCGAVLAVARLRTSSPPIDPTRPEISMNRYVAHDLLTASLLAPTACGRAANVPAAVVSNAFETVASRRESDVARSYLPPEGSYARARRTRIRGTCASTRWYQWRSLRGTATQYRLPLASGRGVGSRLHCERTLTKVDISGRSLDTGGGTPSSAGPNSVESVDPIRAAFRRIPFCCRYWTGRGSFASPGVGSPPIRRPCPGLDPLTTMH